MNKLQKALIGTTLLSTIGLAGSFSLNQYWNHELEQLPYSEQRPSINDEIKETQRYKNYKAREQSLNNGIEATASATFISLLASFLSSTAIYALRKKKE